jgi:plasmid stabilization system protein ParE
LSDNPYLYPEHLLFVRRAALSKFPYHVFYAVNESAAEVEIIAVLHQSRDPDALRKRINLL